MPDPFPPRILVIRRRYLGDIVLLGPLLHNFRLHWPQASITVLTEERFAGILSLNPDVDHVLPHPGHGLARTLAFWRALRRSKFTHVFDLDCNDRSALFTWLTGAPIRSVLQIRRRFGWLYTHHARVERSAYESRHITETGLGLLTLHQIPIVSREVKLVPREEDIAAMRRMIGATGPVLLVHPGSRSPFRLWPAEKFAAVCDRVQDQLGIQAVLVGGPGEKELIEEIRRHAQMHLLTLEEPLSLPRFAALARLGTLLLCHDSGPMHIAAAVGTPVVALFGSQNPIMWRPLGPHHTVLQPPLPCRNCVAPGVCVPGDSYRNYCVQNLEIETVWDAVRTRLASAAV
ncbi:MAG TPA: glycosyltransferase family 9 protein [Opitutaceae bacterium]|nr:glycosyltransferase family 9 protein [Opitutaceae bacterium]